MEWVTKLYTISLAFHKVQDHFYWMILTLVMVETRDWCTAIQILCMHLSWLPILDVAGACSKLCIPSYLVEWLALKA